MSASRNNPASKTETIFFITNYMTFLIIKGFQQKIFGFWAIILEIMTGQSHSHNLQSLKGHDD